MQIALERGSIATLLAFSLITLLVLGGSVQEIRLLATLRQRIRVERHIIETLSLTELQLDGLLLHANHEICTSDTTAQYRAETNQFTLLATCTPLDSVLERQSGLRFFSCRWEAAGKRQNNDARAVLSMHHWLSTLSPTLVWLSCTQ